MWLRGLLGWFGWLGVGLSLPVPALAASRVFRTSFTESANGRMTAIQLGDFDGAVEGPSDCAEATAGPTIDVALTTENGELPILQNECDDARVESVPDTIAVGAFPAGMVQADFDEDTPI